MKYVTTIERMAEARGREIGEARGEARGRARGEARQKAAIALNCLRENIPLETIARCTGLTISQLEGFANEQVQKLQAEQE